MKTRYDKFLVGHHVKKIWPIGLHDMAGQAASFALFFINEKESVRQIIEFNKTV
jgi:hypothetical protein